jgi:hypothetical protein
MRNLLQITAGVALVFCLTSAAAAEILYIEEFDPDVDDQYTTANAARAGEVEAGTAEGFDSANFSDDNFYHSGRDFSLTTNEIALTGYTDIQIRLELGSTSMEGDEGNKIEVINVDTAETVLLDALPANGAKNLVAYTGDEYKGGLTETVLDESGVEIVYDLSDYFAVQPSAIQVVYSQPDSGAANDQAALGYIEVSGVPEPATMAILGLGGLAVVRRRRNR